jgi:hypothetical protein
MDNTHDSEMTRQELIDGIWELFYAINDVRPRGTDFSLLTDEQLGTWYDRLYNQLGD